jgi:hypothetical protein
MYNELGEDEQEGLRRCAREDAQEAKDAYMRAMKNPPSKALEDRQQ